MGTECRAFGLVPQERVIQVANLLRGMCYKYGWGVAVDEPEAGWVACAAAHAQQTWTSAPWFLVENYMYRRILSIMLTAAQCTVWHDRSQVIHSLIHCLA